jgi:hypothetical protein
MTVLITLTVYGSDVGPFDLYSDLDGYTVAFDTNVSKNDLVAGYSATVPDFTNSVKIQSTGTCESSLIVIVGTTTSTSTSTSTSSSTTTTTTTVAGAGFIAVAGDGPDGSFESITCFDPTAYTFYTDAEGLIIALGDHIYTTDATNSPLTGGWYFIEDINSVVRRFEIALTLGEVITILPC